MEGQGKDQENKAIVDVAPGFQRNESDSEVSAAYKETNAIHQLPSSHSTAEECLCERNHLPNGFPNLESHKNNLSVDQLHGRICHLEELLACKEANLFAVMEELNAVKDISCIDTSMGPLGSGLDGVINASMFAYNIKLQEYASALQGRDEMIKKLKESLEQSVQDREDFKEEASRIIHSLQSQLHSVKQHVQSPQMKLLEALREKDTLLHKTSSELAQYKVQTSKEENLERELKISARLEKEIQMLQQQVSEKDELCQKHLLEKTKMLALHEELQEALERERDCSKRYSQLVQELDVKLKTKEEKNEEYREKIGSLEQQLKEIGNTCTLYQPQIETLHCQLLEERLKSDNVLQQLEDVHKQLVLEQERYKACVGSLDIANANMEALQRKYSEIEAVKSNHRAKVSVTGEQLENAALQSDLMTSKEKLNQEQCDANSFEDRIEGLGNQSKSYPSQEKTPQYMQNKLLAERQTSARWESEVETGNCQLNDLQARTDEECQKLSFQIQENPASVKKYHQDTNCLENKLEIEGEIAPSCNDKNIICQKAVCDNCCEQVKSLESKLKFLTNANECLKREREETESELERVKNLFTNLKTEFECVSRDTKENLSKKEEDITALHKVHEKLLKDKVEVETFNMEIKELLSVKIALEKELHEVKVKYCEEIDILKNQVSELKTYRRSADDETVEALLKKCRDDLEFLRSCSSNSSAVGSACFIEMSDGVGIDQHLIDGVPSIMNCSIPGIASLGKLLEICERYSQQKGDRSCVTMSGQLSKLAYSLEKLQLQFDVCVKQNHSLHSERKELLSQLETLQNITKKAELEHCDSPKALKVEISRLRQLLSQQCVTELPNTNETALCVLRKELEEKHRREMEELRTYFEQKCADFEKHYSEEVFSQHSRKLSDCSSASESELVSEMYYAGPGSSCSGKGGQSHFCDLLGENSFRDIEDHSRSGALERERSAAVRLALKSQHEAQLEAQKEYYEAKLEEIVQSLKESHIDELRLQSKQLQDMHDAETTYKMKLTMVEEEISSLKQLLHEKSHSHSLRGEQADDDNTNDKPVSPNLVNQQSVSCVEKVVTNPDRISQPQLQSELERMADLIKRKDSEIAALKRKLRLNDEVMSKMEKDFSNLRSKYESDMQSFSASVNEKVRQIKDLNQKIQELSSSLEEDRYLRQKLELELNSKYSKLLEEHRDAMKRKEQEYEMKITDLVSKHKEDLCIKDLKIEKIVEERVTSAVEEKKKQIEAEYTEYLEFVKKCADDTKIELVHRHGNEIKQVTDKYEKQISNIQNGKCSSISGDNRTVASVPNSRSSSDVESFIKESALCACLQELLELSIGLSMSHKERLEQIVVKLCEEEAQCHRKLHEDLEMRLEEARGDIVQALELQIQQLLDDTNDAVDKPLELQQLESKFASKYLLKLSNMRRECDAKISELNAKHAAQLALLRCENQTINNGAISPGELEKLYKERDCLRNVAAALRDVVAELVRYFMSWEDDFSNTLMDELVNLDGCRDDDIFCDTQPEESIAKEQSLDTTPKIGTTDEDEIPVIIATPARPKRFSGCVKRVHFAPDISGIMSFIDDESLLEGVGLNCSIRDASLNFHEELDRCLNRLRSESAALYALSKPALCRDSMNKCARETNKEDTEDKLSEKLADASQTIARLQRENEELQHQLHTLHEEQEKSFAELQSNRERLETLEHEVRQQAEIVAEGYGEGEQSSNSTLPSSPRATTVEELQNKARSLLLGIRNTENTRGVVSPNPSQHLPHIVDELCRDWERLAEDSRRLQDDLQQQVEAADKQLRATRTFMDEQASERELEREECVQEIKRLQELLRDQDRDRTSQRQMNHEVEVLEGQLKETQSELQEKCEKLEKLTSEHKQAVEKIWTLRDIISDLEVQVATKAEEAASLSVQNEALQGMIEQQGRTQLELAQEMEELQICSDNGRLADHITQLEEQLRKHQELAEQLGDPSTIDQMKVQLCELSATLEQHTKELECAYASTGLPASPCLSSPSEDVSIRETLEAIRAAAEKREVSTQPSQCVVLPFNEVSQVMDQWQRHARADDAILKKIRDLDMQLDDVRVERDAVATRLQEQMLFASSLQSKLDEYRRKADVKLSQATAEMQNQIDDLRSEINTCVETLEMKEKQIGNLRSSLCQAENNIRKREAEVRKSSEANQSIAIQLQNQVSKLSADKEKLQALLSEKDAMHGSLPSLVESMLFDKNADIDRLEKQVHRLTKQMECSSHYVATPSTSLEFEYVESDVVRARLELSPVLELRRNLTLPPIDESSYEKGSLLPNDTFRAPINHQMSLQGNGPNIGSENDISLKPVLLEKTMPQSQLEQHLSGGSNLDTLNSSGSFDTSSLSSCERKVAALEQELNIKNQELADCLKQINENSVIISELEEKCKHVVECEHKLNEMFLQEQELKTTIAELCNDLSTEKEKFQKALQTKNLELQQLKDKLPAVQTNCRSSPADNQLSDQSAKKHETIEPEAEDSEIQRLRNEVCATQSILSNLQRKVQEAKQIARSPSRSSPDNNQALKLVQNELEAAKQEIVELKDLCKSIRSEVETEYQLKQGQHEIMLSHEQLAKQSLQETLEKVRQEGKIQEFIRQEEQLKELERRLMKKDEETMKLRSELHQLNMECVTLRHQLSEVATLKHKLDSEKKFADTLKEELLSFKNKAASLEKEYLSLKESSKDLQAQLSAARNNVEKHDNSEKLLKEISDLKSATNSLLRDQANYKQQIGKLSHDNAVLREENADVGKELSDMKQVIIRMHEVQASHDEVQRALQSKSEESHTLRVQMNSVVNELDLLRSALKNMDRNVFDFFGLPEEDLSTLKKLQEQLSVTSQRGGGDGPWNKLSVTKTDIHEICPSSDLLKESESLDDLTGLVQHELDLSVQLDHSLLQTIDDRAKNKKPSLNSVLVERKNTSERTEPSEANQKVLEITSTHGDIAQIKMHHLEKELCQMRATVRLLHAQLETKQAEYCKLQQQDCDLIGKMRMKLSEALDGQAALRLQLQSGFQRQQSSLEAHPNEATSEILKLQAENESLEKQLRRLQEVEIQRSRRRAVTEEKHRQRIDQLQSLHSETHQECVKLREKLASVNQKLLLAQEEFAKDRDAHLKNHVPYVERLKNMNGFLEEHIEENVRMAKQMEDLTEEHRKLRQKIAHLEGQLAEKRSNESFEAIQARFATERADWESEQKLLLMALDEAQKKQKYCLDSDVEERVSHLFGRYLRMQSYRKALVWQKRYLLSVISGINESKNLTSSHLANFTGIVKERQCTARRKLRSVVMVIMAIHRMQFMVERWLRGKRIGSGVVVQQTVSQFTLASSTLPQGKQPFLHPSQFSLSRDELRNSLSQSPPTLERPRQPRSQLTAATSQTSRLPMNSRASTFTSNFSESVTKFNLVQQQFDALLSNPPK